ncbi:MAG: DnaJ domain-containing protein [Dehalococcoidales bacterium]|jgi:molecular chaperone DnaJ
MVNDPYRVLGVPSTATNQEIKKSYRNLARKYHPDANPGDKSSEQKMKEINAAYDQVTRYKHTIGNTGAGTSGSYRSNDPFAGYSGYGGFGGYQRSGTSYQRESAEMRSARNYINSRYYQDAIYVLNNIMDRNARWYYYSALAYAGLGDRIKAQQFAQRAVQMEPGNPDYFILLVSLQNRQQAYGQATRRYNSPFETFAKFFIGFLVLNLLARFLGVC